MNHILILVYTSQCSHTTDGL